MERGFVEVPHTADIALRVWGGDLAELFVHAAQGMAWLLADVTHVAPQTDVPLELDGVDAETLLVTWLGELLYLNERDGLVFTDFELHEVTPTQLRGVARGGYVAGLRSQVKAVTFSDLEIRPSERGLETVIVFDV